MSPSGDTPTRGPEERWEVARDQLRDRLIQEGNDPDFVVPVGILALLPESLTQTATEALERINGRLRALTAERARVVEDAFHEGYARGWSENTGMTRPLAPTQFMHEAWDASQARSVLEEESGHA